MSTCNKRNDLIDFIDKLDGLRCKLFFLSSRLNDGQYGEDIFDVLTCGNLDCEVL